MKVTLQINGRKMFFSEEELIAILEKHFSSEVTQPITVGNITYEIAIIPTEGKLFKVCPNEIDRKLFEEQRKDERQEETRQLINEAFAEMDINPEKYAKEFYTMFPEKTWETLEWDMAKELEKLAERLGHHMTNWIELSLEWAQRISNGESWEYVCNKADDANWYRLVRWKNGYYRRVGGARKSYDSGAPASGVYYKDYLPESCFKHAVPSVVMYAE